MNVFDYLTWRCDVPLSVSPFNPVDNLVFSELAYTDLTGIVPADGTEIPLSEACARFFETHDREEIKARTAYTAPAPFLMESMLAGCRFRDVKLCYYVTVMDREDTAQFAALTCLLPDGTAYVSFRGTDGTVVGWKEDFMLSYRSGTRGQQLAADYLQRVADGLALPLRVGGHSKGGNFAVYAAVFSEPEIRSRITEVWTNDGPGFREEVLSLPAYREIMAKTISVVPDTSIIGLLLTNDCTRRVVRSTNTGIAQHDGFSWETGPVDFVPGELSRRGEYVERTISDWVARQNDETLQSLVDSAFRIIEAPGEDSFHAMTARKLKTAEVMMLAVRALPREKQKELLQATGQLFQSTGSTARELIAPARTSQEDAGSE